MDRVSKRGVVFYGLLCLLIIIFFVFINFSTTGSSQFRDTNFFKEDLVYLGDADVENELLLVVDYDCPWCKSWIEEVYPHLDDYITSGEYKFRIQSMVYLNEKSLSLAKFDQNLKNHYPDKYFEVVFKIMGDQEDPDYGTEKYFLSIATLFHLDDSLMLGDVKTDPINITRKYTRELDIETVPSVFLNGEMIDEPFNTDSLLKSLN